MEKPITKERLARVNSRSDDTISFTNGGKLSPEEVESSAFESRIFSTTDGKIWIKPANTEKAMLLTDVLLNHGQLQTLVHGALPNTATITINGSRRLLSSNPTFTVQSAVGGGGGGEGSCSKIELLLEPLELMPTGLIEIELDGFDLQKDLMQISVAKYLDFRGKGDLDIQPKYESAADLLENTDDIYQFVMGLALDSQTLTTTHLIMDYTTGRNTLQHCGTFPTMMVLSILGSFDSEKDKNIEVGTDALSLPKLFSAFLFPKTNGKVGMFIFAPLQEDTSKYSTKKGGETNAEEFHFRNIVTSLKVLKGG
ncbi:MAG: hypothetical protein FWE31_02275 [Firmicutes bacterium]|nr:hypothetical protein [Bacillota bacterium]